MRDYEMLNRYYHPPCECSICEEEFEDEENVKSIRRFGKCSQCYAEEIDLMDAIRPEHPDNPVQ